MSPAGFHTEGRVTPYMHYIGLMFYHVIPALVDHISLPDSMIGLISKLQQDVVSWPASRDLLQYITSLIIGGTSHGDSVMVRSASLVSSMIKFGFSTDLAKQFF